MWTFDPIFKTTIWGGERIAPYKHTVTDLHGIGESWELSGVEGSESTVADGPDKGLSLGELIKRYKTSLMGERNYRRFGDTFPLLIKFIDAADDLSIQVHPDDDMARREGKPFGKTEMWYVLDAAKGARLANGFKEPVDPARYPELVESGKIIDVLRFEPVRRGDVFFIPAGRVHAIGKGAFIAEIQQTSDITYRIYDYHRKDAEGRERELHTGLALEAIDFNDCSGNAVRYKECPDIPVNVVTSPFFTTNILEVDHEIMRDYSEWDTFVVLIATEGSATLECGGERREVKAGTTVLIPASANSLTIIPDGTFRALETYIK